MSVAHYHLHGCDFKVGLLGHDVTHVGVLGEGHDLCNRILCDWSWRVGRHLEEYLLLLLYTGHHRLNLNTKRMQQQNTFHPNCFDPSSFQLGRWGVVKAGGAVEYHLKTQCDISVSKLFNFFGNFSIFFLKLFKNFGNLPCCHSQRELEPGVPRFSCLSYSICNVIL